jgi:hypothetical protein
MLTGRLAGPVEEGIEKLTPRDYVIKLFELLIIIPILVCNNMTRRSRPPDDFQIL